MLNIMLDWIRDILLDIQEQVYLAWYYELYIVLLLFKNQLTTKEN
jgi:hypothetical protein